MKKASLSSVLRKARNTARDYVHTRDDVDSRLNKNIANQRAVEYSTIREKTKIDDRTILYESFWGRGLTDNPYALFKYLLSESEYQDYTHIWCIEDQETCVDTVERYSKYQNVRFVVLNTDEYYRALSSAKYLINNVTFPSYFVKKDGQIYINTWHGTPLKSMGYEQTGGNMSSANTMRNFLQADYLVSANSIMTEMYLDSYKLKNLFPGCIIQEGYPRNDLLRTTAPSEIIEKLKSCGIEINREQTTILYAPTWRKNTRAAALQSAEELIAFKDELERVIGKNKYQILIKPHQYVYNIVKEYDKYDGIFVPSTIDSNELMSIVDILVSDYSSIFFDYMALSRPILFYITDAETYAMDRGLSFNLDDLPGPYTDKVEELANYISDIENTTSKFREKYISLQSKVCAYDDGFVCKRIVDYLFGGQDGIRLVYGGHEKKRLLISIGLVNENGITHALFSLLNAFDYENWDVTVYVSARSWDKEMVRKINEDINKNARVLVRVGPVNSKRKTLIRREFIEKQGLRNPLWKALYPFDVLKLEFKRAFGNAAFDYIVDYNGYGTLLMPMLAMGDAVKKSVWLHNDIYADMNKVVQGKKPNYIPLNLVTSFYYKYDNLVSCGKSVMEVNREKLATKATYPKFKYAKNTFDYSRFLDCAQEQEVVVIGDDEYYLTTPVSEFEPWSPAVLFKMPEKDHMNFVTMGRFSTEKNHICLIEAFGKFVGNHPDARLYIIGGGPLEIEIRDRIRALNLEENVILTGRLQNPYAVMKRCDCFILPSIHEGQPLVLLEARACGLPIIVSNFSSVKDSLFTNGQLVIEPTEEGILGGLSAFARGEVPTVEFDVQQYNQEAYQEFIDAIM